MTPRMIASACGTAAALLLAPQALAQTSSDAVRTAPPRGTPSAREVVPTAASTDSALALFEGLWKVQITMNQTRALATPGTISTPEDRSIQPADRTADRPADRTVPVPETSTLTRPGADSMISNGATFEGYSDSRLIMDGRVLQETMVIPRQAFAQGERKLPLSPSTPPAPPTAREGTANEMPKDPRDEARELSRETRRDATADRERDRLTSDPQGEPLLEDAITTRSFLSLNAELGTYTMVCMDSQSGQIKHTTGTFATQADRITFEGYERATESAPVDQPLTTPPEPAAKQSRLESSHPLPSTDRLEPTRASGVMPDRDPLTVPPTSSVTTDRAVVDGARVDPRLTTQPGDRIGRVGYTGAPDDRLRNTWAGEWDGAVRVVVDLLGPDERRVTIYRLDEMLPERADARANADGQATPVPPADEVRGSSIWSGQIICQATYTRVAEAEAAGVRRMFREQEPLSARGDE